MFAHHPPHAPLAAVLWRARTALATARALLSSRRPTVRRTRPCRCAACGATAVAAAAAVLPAGWRHVVTLERVDGWTACRLSARCGACVARAAS